MRPRLYPTPPHEHSTPWNPKLLMGMIKRMGMIECSIFPDAPLPPTCVRTQPPPCRNKHAGSTFLRIGRGAALMSCTLIMNGNHETGRQPCLKAAAKAERPETTKPLPRPSLADVLRSGSQTTAVVGIDESGPLLLCRVTFESLGVSKQARTAPPPHTQVEYCDRLEMPICPREGNSFSSPDSAFGAGGVDAPPVISRLATPADLRHSGPHACSAPKVWSLGVRG